MTRAMPTRQETRLLQWPCPHCRAGVNEWCRRAWTGQPITYLHVARQRERRACPVHRRHDCSALLNGCTRLTAASPATPGVI